VQRALVACGGAQCGICTPGIAVCAANVIDRGLIYWFDEQRESMGGGDPAGSAGGAGGKAPRGIDDVTARARVRDLLAGNICRCTGYQLIVDAVIAAAREVEREPSRA
jgi:aerobic-type carbon monoxide dehydrogenase small subunit (CoxS/CutS family)